MSAPNSRVLAVNTYPTFACTASACRHTCCVGWEIDIDAASLTRYEAIPGSVGDRIRAGIRQSEDGSPCFGLTAEGRCPNLDKQGLCTVISALGEEALCAICRDHPRFRNYLPDGTVELGLGLCCEAACDGILGSREPMHIVPLSEAAAARERAIAAAQEEAFAVSEEDAAALTVMQALRGDLLSAVTDRTVPLGTRLARMADIVGGLFFPAMQWSDWAALLASLERLDPAWDACLEALCGADVHSTDARDDPSPLMAELWNEPSLAYEHLTAYFLYRYMTATVTLDYGEPALPLAFAVASTALIHAIARTTGTDVREIARMYSSEIEYSEDNRDALWDVLAAALV